MAWGWLGARPPSAARQVRLSWLLWWVAAGRSAGYQCCRIAVFQVGRTCERPAGLETRDTAGLETCATPQGSEWSPFAHRCSAAEGSLTHLLKTARPSTEHPRRYRGQRAADAGFLVGPAERRASLKTDRRGVGNWQWL